MPHVRLAKHDDLSEVEGIVSRAYSPYVERIGQNPGSMADDYCILIGSGCVHVVEIDGRVQAILVLIPEASTLLLGNIAVEPSAQGMGLGGRLLNYAEQVARTLGYRAIRLYTNEAMTENIVLYNRIGYAETHRAEEHGLKRVHMTKSLA